MGASRTTSVAAAVAALTIFGSASITLADEQRPGVANWQWSESGRHVSATQPLTKPKPMPQLVQVTASTIAPGLEHSQYDNGVVEADVLKANLAEPTLSVGYTYPGSVAAATAMTSQAKRSGTIAAVNGDFFDIGDTNAPRGVGIDAGKLLNAPLGGWNEGVAFSQSAPGTTGRLAQIALEATVTLPNTTVLRPSNLNSPTVAVGGIGVYTPTWGAVARSQTVNGATGIREVEGGIVKTCG